MLLKLHMRITIALLSVIVLGSCSKEPEAFFSVPALVWVNEPVQFSNYSTDATSYEWDFGDGTSTTEVSPVHTYNNAGIYTVTLTAINKNKKSQASKNIFITGSSSVNLEGTYITINDNCVSNSYSMFIGSSVETLFLGNLSNVSTGQEFIIHQAGNTFNIPQQDNGLIIVSGNGTLIGDTLVINYLADDGNNLSGCSCTAIKQ